MQPLHASLPRTTDAVVVVPGIMGSELRDADGQVVWGLSARKLGRIWLTGNVDALLVSDQDRTDDHRLTPTRLLRRVGFLPFLGGLEPYTDLLSHLSGVVRSPQALSEFPYDWRLSIEHNGRLLARRCEELLSTWKAVVDRERLADPAEVKIVVVAHSMGGLVARYAAEVLGAAPLMRSIITLGTPHYGSLKALQMVSEGEGGPLPQAAARRLARSCPGVYDLLPRYRCVTYTKSSSTDDTRGLSLEDVSAVGGSRELASEAADRFGALTSEPEDLPVPVIPLVGAYQPTLQQVTLDSGKASFSRKLLGLDHGGDSTVYRASAAPAGLTAFPLPQQHGALAKTREAIAFITDKLIGADIGPPLGTRPVGIDLPGSILAGTRITAFVEGTSDPVGVSVTSVNMETGVRTGWLPGIRADDRLRFTGPMLPPGLHRVEAKAGGFSPVTDLVLVENPATEAGQ